MHMNRQRFNSGYSLFDRNGRAIYSTDFENDPAWLFLPPTFRKKGNKLFIAEVQIGLCFEQVAYILTSEDGKVIMVGTRRPNPNMRSNSVRKVVNWLIDWMKEWELKK